MAKRAHRSNDDPPAPDASAWLENRHDDGLLDLDVLAAMPAADVRSELRAHGASDHAAFMASLKQRIGDMEPATARPSEREADRPPVAQRRRVKVFGLRGALIFSAIVVVAVSLGPFIVQKMASIQNPELIVAPAPPIIDPTSIPPTRLEGPAPGELVRGVKYVMVGLGRAALNTPLPDNPGSLQATYQLRMMVDPQGNVVGLESLSGATDAFEPVVIDSLLRWRFEPGRDGGTRTNAGTITILYAPD